MSRQMSTLLPSPQKCVATAVCDSGNNVWAPREDPKEAVRTSDRAQKFTPVWERHVAKLCTPNLLVLKDAEVHPCAGEACSRTATIQSQGAHHPTPSLVRHDQALAPEGAEVNPVWRGM